MDFEPLALDNLYAIRCPTCEQNFVQRHGVPEITPDSTRITLHCDMCSEDGEALVLEIWYRKQETFVKLVRA